MNIPQTLVSAAAVVSLLVACDRAQQPSTATSATAPVGMVDVPTEGKQFDPPIKPEYLPAHAWYCDMGTVHYARTSEGDGTCPICRMKLKQKPAP